MISSSRAHRRYRPLAVIVSLALFGAGCGADEQGQATAVAGAADELSAPDDPSGADQSDGEGASAEEDGAEADEEDGEDGAGQDEGQGSDDSASSTTEGPDDKAPVDDDETTTTSSSTTSSTSSTTEPKIERQVVEIEDLVISEAGIGPVKLGMSLSELIEALGPGFDVDSREQIRVDLDGVVISQDGHDLFFAVDTRGEGLDLFLVNSPKLGLASGLGVGTTLADAVSRHGEPTLSYSTNNESREFVAFADGTGQQGSGLGFETFDAGIYTTQDEYNETTEYRPEAKVQVVWIS